MLAAMMAAMSLVANGAWAEDAETLSSPADPQANLSVEYGNKDLVSPTDYSPSLTPGPFTIAGATLFSDIAEFPALGNDWYNADCDFDCVADPNACPAESRPGGTRCEKDDLNAGELCDVDADCDQAAVGDGLGNCVQYVEGFGHPCETLDNPTWPIASTCAYRGFITDRPFCADEEVDVLTTIPDQASITTWWLFNYRAVGSSNGLQEFVNYNVSALNAVQNSPLSGQANAICPGFIGDAGTCTGGADDGDLCFDNSECDSNVCTKACPQACQDVDDTLFDPSGPCAGQCAAGNLNAGDPCVVDTDCDLVAQDDELGTCDTLTCPGCDAVCVCNELGVTATVCNGGIDAGQTCTVDTDCDLDADNDQLGTCSPVCDITLTDSASVNAHRWAIAVAINESLGCTDPGCIYTPAEWPVGRPSDKSRINTVQYYDPGSGGICLGGPAGLSPDAECPDTCAYVCAKTVDGASADVPITWTVRKGPDDQAAQIAAFDRKPNDIGYGQNPTLSWDTGFKQSLKTLGFDVNRNGAFDAPLESLNFDTADPDCRTVYDNFVAYSPVSVIANPGTGIPDGEVLWSDLQYLWLTGRFSTGENLIGVTRDSGSGTRNTAMNALGIDPSWGRGDNLGTKQSSSDFTNIGPGTQPTNCGGSSVLENSVQNRRLGIGYTGIAGSSRSAADSASGRYEVLAVKNDVFGTESADYVFPTRDTVLLNDDPDTGWRIAALQTFASLGNANGNRLDKDPLFDPSVPPINNQPYAEFLLNLLDSQAAFDPDFPDQQFFMPGQETARQFLLTVGPERIPTVDDPTDFVVNVLKNQDLQNWERDNVDFGSGDICVNAGCATVSGNPCPWGCINPAGRTPTRVLDPDFAVDDRYSDGKGPSAVGNGYCYVDLSGAPAAATVTAGTNLSLRNRVAGDFNCNDLRDGGDAEQMVVATLGPRGWQQALPAACTPVDARGMNYDMPIPEVIGDYNGDGNLDKEDWRYWMDGLHLNAQGNVDRAEAAALIDDAIISNFGTAFLPWGLSSTDRWPAPAPQADCGLTDPTPVAPRMSASVANMKATLAPYVAGDFRGDIAGLPTSPGAYPTGADGLIDEQDIDYVCANIGDFRDARQAVALDLSADMTGDLLVDGLDLEDLVVNILQTQLGDFNLDGIVDATDEAIRAAGTGDPCNNDASCGWVQGDCNCDGLVNDADITCALPCATDEFCSDQDACTYDTCADIACDNAPRDYGDTDGNGALNLFDIFCVLDLIGPGSDDLNCTKLNADIEPCAGNSVLSLLDVFAILDAIGGIDPCGCSAPAGDGTSTPSRDLEVRASERSTDPVHLKIVPATREARAGDTVRFDVFAMGATNVRGYEIWAVVDGLRSGTAFVVPSIEERNDNVMNGVDAYTALNEAQNRIVVAAIDGPVPARRGTAMGYLGSFSVTLSDDASGTLRVGLDTDAERLIVGSGRGGVYNVTPGSVRIVATERGQ